MGKGVGWDEGWQLNKHANQKKFVWGQGKVDGGEKCYQLPCCLMLCSVLPLKGLSFIFAFSFYGTL